jgi:restriction endonuclease Mrr
LRTNDSSAGAFVVVLVLIIGLPIYFCVWLATEHPAIAVCVACVIACNVARSIWEARVRRRALAAHAESTMALATALVSEHAAELAVRRKQLTTVLNYGVVDDTKWRQDIEFFIDKVIEPAGCAIRGSESRLEIVRRAIAEATNDFDASRLCFTPDMDPIDYEMMVADALTDLGWQTRLTKGSGDQGIDVIAEKRQRRVVIQCKRYASSIGNAAVQEAHAGKSFEKAQYAAVVSNAPFTRGARQLAASTNVILLHDDELAQLDMKIFTADAVLAPAGNQA